ncbi:MAG: TolC family protein [Desulfobacteraceae bacterium]|nr:TolC family protein [Desulfobacteraceae bacterium]
MKNTGKICFILTAALILPAFMCTGAATENQRPISLEKAYSVALEQNEQIKISRQRLRQAETDIAAATSNLYPQISASASYTRQKQPETSGGTLARMSPTTPKDYGMFSLELDQHIYQWGKAWSGRNMAQHYYQSSRLRHLRRAQEILYQVSLRYYEVLLGRRSIEIAKNALKRAKQQLQRAEARYEVGVLTQTDVLRAEVQLARSREQLERARNQHDIARERLALEMGIESVPGDLMEPEKRSFPEMKIPALYEKALENRKDLSQAEKQLKGAEERVDFEQADFFPNLSLRGQYQRTDEKVLFSGEPDDWQASLVLSYPLFTGWERSAEVNKAESKKKEAEYALARLRKQIRNEVRSVYLDIKTQKEVIDQLEQQVQSAKRNYRQVTAQFEEGLVTAVDQVDAFTALNEAENRLAQAYYTYQLDLIRLKLATGTFQSDLLKKEILNESS